MGMTSHRRLARRLSWLLAVTVTLASLFAPSSAAAVIAAPGPAVPAAEVTPTPTPTPEGTPTPTPEATPTPPAAFTVLTPNPTCDGNVPYLAYEIEVDGTDAATATIIFLHPADPEQDVVHADLPLNGRVLWPGAIPAGDAGLPDWPGWSFVDGLWVEGDAFDWARPEVEVLFQVNPEAIVSVAYPSATADCDPNPPGGDVGSATGTPNVTLPPTDTLPAGSSAPSGDSWRLILLAMAGIMAAALLLTPADAVIRRDRRRR